MIDQYSRNNESLKAIPFAIRNGETKSLSSLKVWSRIRWRQDNLFLKGYELDICFGFIEGERNRARAARSNGWLRGGGFIVRRFGKPVSKDEERRVRKQIVERLCNALERDDITNYPITRAQFVQVATFPNIKLKGFHTHHLNDGNIIKNSDKDVLDWTLATDDRVCNIDVILASAHIREHHHKGDAEAYDYTQLKHIRENYLRRLKIEIPYDILESNRTMNLTGVEPFYFISKWSDSYACFYKEIIEGFD